VSVWAFHAGQICTAPTRAVVHRSRYDELVGALAEAAPTLTIGPPESPDTVVGPLISAPHRARVESYIQAGADEGGRLVVDGRNPAGVDRGYYVGPTLIAGCHNGMKVVREEIFGPVISVVPFDADEAAIAIANDSDFGLYDYVFSEDTARAYSVGERLEAGHVGVNTAQRNHEAAFGGWKLSGIGRDGGVFGLHAYTEMQSLLWPG
jgi:acyl-CoA reductase-like NAD-dependent aldehyde dehydrogenase